ncbi:sprouty-related, EVH1 domain-containing protein 1 [Sinocyclocheilus grahami]|uniref:sprouty-related, EVH1 domain-containing protein 1 n=1 Tax=Sinocyclocheilus grahami TaxID=75366 RepID=UPI0007AD2B8D|nr:PREDICTED: sprouty-related, EVH1 domain-containing protein 1-like [Sinocyclocheilus grahami]
MSEESNPNSEESYARVRAVVMGRDDSSGGWLPLGSGGPSCVTVHKVSRTEADGSSGADFLIHGERLRDKTVLLDCVIRRDLVYNKVNPIFHHWRIGSMKLGLTFQSPADARAFDRGIRRALEDITQAVIRPNHTPVARQQESCGERVSMVMQSHSQSRVFLSEQQVSDSLLLCYSKAAVRRRACWEFMELICETMSVGTPVRDVFCSHGVVSTEPFRSSYVRAQPFDKALTASQRFLPPQVSFNTRRHVSFHMDDEEIVRINPRKDVLIRGYEDYRHPVLWKQDPEREEPDASAAFSKLDGKKCEYLYGEGPEQHIGGKDSVKTQQPVLGKCKASRRRREDGERSRCIYCREMFNHEDNRRGQCPDAPDPIKQCIYKVSCMLCAESMLYHCMSDSEGDFSDPCSCDISEEHFCVRWLALLGLSLLAPCMCCYPPLRACHRCGEACRCCGGKHKAAG